MCDGATCDGHGRSSLLCSYIQHQATIPRPALSDDIGLPLPPSGSIYCRDLSRLTFYRIISRTVSYTVAASRKFASLHIFTIDHNSIKALQTVMTLKRLFKKVNIFYFGLAVIRDGSCKILHEEIALQWVVASGHTRDLAMQNSW